MALIALEYTLVGMGVVFAVLLFLILIISLLKYLPGASGNKKAAAPAPAAETNTSQQLTKALEEEALADHLEKIAVISAAIAAFMAEQGVDSDGYIVRKITRK